MAVKRTRPSTDNVRKKWRQRVPFLEGSKVPLQAVSQSHPTIPSNCIEERTYLVCPISTYTLDLPTHVHSRDEIPPPPGFVGSRGRRTDPNIGELIKGLKSDQGSMPLAFLIPLRDYIKKNDPTLVYKDGFLGARG